MAGQILATTLVAAPKLRNTNAEKADIWEGGIPQDWQDKPTKLSYKDRYARWTLKFTKAKRQDDGTIPATDLAIPFFGYKSHISIDRKFRPIQKWKATGAAASDGADCARDCWTKPTPPQQYGQTRCIAQKPTKTLWKSRTLSRRSTGKSRISSPCPDTSRDPILENLSSVLMSSMSLLIRRDKRACLSTQWALPEQP